MPVAIDKPKQLRKGDKFTCPECKRENATYESGGLCGVCNSKRRKLQRAGDAAKPAKPKPVVKPAVVYPDLEETVKRLPDTFGKVQNAAGDVVPFGVAPHVLSSIRCLLSGAERRLLVAVSGMPDDEAIIHAALCVQQLEV